MSPVIVIGGPTASGKSALALAIAERFNGAVINADSMQIYCGLEIISAAPDAAAQARRPHRLYGVMDPATPCSAGMWREMAVAEIERAHGRGQVPIVVGGTGLYLRSLMSGIDRMPPVPAGIREKIRARMAADGPEVLHAELRKADPETASRVPPGDRQRIARALEIWKATGKKLSNWQTGGASGGDAVPFTFKSILLMPDRQALYQRCDARFLEMLDHGVLDEIGALADRALDPELPAMKALGIPELIAHIGGNLSREDAIAAAQQATRRYVKRQFTWFKHQIIADLEIPEKYSEKLDEIFFSEISKFLLTNPV